MNLSKFLPIKMHFFFINTPTRRLQPEMMHPEKINIIVQPRDISFRSESKLVEMEIILIKIKDKYNYIQMKKMIILLHNIIGYNNLLVLSQTCLVFV